MESIIERKVDPAEKLLDSWEAIVAALPADLKQSAVQYKALRRRREVHSAEDLMRLVLGYSVLDKSLSGLSAWAVLQNIADLSTPGLYERLCAPGRGSGGSCSSFWNKAAYVCRRGGR